MKMHIDEITADIEAADFSTDAAALTFAAKACSDYSARELFAYEDFLPCWNFNEPDERRRFARIWKQIVQGARALIVQVRTSGAGAIKNRLVRGANGEKLPHPQMGDDLNDGLFDMSVVTLRQIAARALENNTTVQDVAHKVDAARGEVAAVGADAHAGRVAAEKLADELEGWREWIALCVRKCSGTQTDQPQADAPQMFVAVRDAIYQLWKDFNAEPADCEMRDGSLRKPGQKRTYAECVEQYGATAVYTSPVTGRKFYLSEYCPNAQMLEKIINAARMAEKRKHGAKNSPHKRRTRKRQK